VGSVRGITVPLWQHFFMTEYFAGKGRPRQEGSDVKELYWPTGDHAAMAWNWWRMHLGLGYCTMWQGDWSGVYVTRPTI